VATRYLLDRRRTGVEMVGWSFDAFADDLAAGLGAAPSAQPDAELLAEEVRLGCTLGMLQCLDRDHRLAYILGEVFELPSPEAAELAGVTAATHRKRLSRARAALRDFVRDHCGIVDPANPCRCARRVDRAVEVGRIDPGRLLFVGHPTRGSGSGPAGRTDRTGRADRAGRASVEMQALHDAAALLRAHPEYAAPRRLRSAVGDLLAARSLEVLEDDPEP
jgi:hypothetical protein